MTIDRAPADPSNEPAPSFEFGADEPGASFECRLDDARSAACAPHSGLHRSTTARTLPGARDRRRRQHRQRRVTAGRSTRPPRRDARSLPPDPSNEPPPSFEFSADEAARFECRSTARDWAPCTRPQHVGPLADGAHSFEVRATDAAGNTGAAAVRLDGRHGRAGVDDRRRAVATRATSRAELRVQRRRAGARFECRLDDARLDGMREPADRRTARRRRAHVRGRAPPTPPATRRAPPPRWTVDTVAPARRSTARRRSEQRARAELRVQRRRARRDVRVPARRAASGGVRQPAVRRPSPTARTRSRCARPTPPATPAPPARTLDGRHDRAGGDASTRLRRSEQRAHAELRVQPPTRRAASSAARRRRLGAVHEPAGYIGPLADGATRFAVRATDAAGNTGAAASYTWTVDTIAPDDDASTPRRLTRATTRGQLRVHRRARARTFECRARRRRLDACTSPQLRRPAPTAPHTSQVRATDAAGNTGAAATLHLDGRHGRAE